MNLSIHVHFLLHWVFLAFARAFSSCSEWRPLSGCGVWASHYGGFSCRRAHALGVGFSNCGTQAQDLRHMSPVALWHVESTWTEDQTHVLGIDRQIFIPGSPGKSSSSFLDTLIPFKITYRHQYVLPLNTSACISFEFSICLWVLKTCF